MISASLVKELREKSGAGMLDCKKALEACNGDIAASIDWLREKGISKAAKKADRIAAEGVAEIKIDGNNAVIIELNSETDFVAKNEEFKELVSDITDAILVGNPTSEADVLALTVDGETIEEMIASKTATIGEKISFRRFTKLSKEDNEVFGSYIHMGGKIAVLIKLTGATEDVAKDVAMHAAAMRPTCVSRNEVPAGDVERERTVLKEQAIEEGKPAEIAEKMVEGRINKFYKEICLEEQPFVKDGDVSVGTYVKNNNGSIATMIRYEVGEGIEKKEENFAEEVMKQIQN